jgi:hypothetical protein
MRDRDLKALTESYLSIYENAGGPSKTAIRIDPAKGDSVVYSQTFKDDLASNSKKHQEVAMVKQWIKNWEEAKGENIVKFEPKYRTFVRELNVTDAKPLISSEININNETRMLYIVQVNKAIHLLAIVMPAKPKEIKPEQITDPSQIDMEPWKRFQRNPQQVQPQQQETQEEPAHVVIFVRAWLTYDEYNPMVKRKQKHQSGINAYSRA